MVETNGAKSGIVHIRGNRSGHGEGTDRAGDESASSGLIGNTICGATCDGCRHDVHFMHERAKIDIVDNALKELLIFAPAGWFFLKEEIVKADRGRAKGVGLDDVGAGFEILAVNFFDHFGLG